MPRMTTRIDPADHAEIAVPEPRRPRRGPAGQALAADEVQPIASPAEVLPDRREPVGGHLFVVVYEADEVALVAAMPAFNA